MSLEVPYHNTQKKRESEEQDNTMDLNNTIIA